MKYSHKLSDAVHILSYVEIYKDGDLSSQAIASSIQSNPSLIRRMMSMLVKAKLLVSTPGTIAPKLARPMDMITLLDIYRAIEPNPDLLHVDEQTNMDCLVGANIQATLNDAYRRVQTAAEAEMAQITLEMLVQGILTQAQRT